jgi:hypothetical protein
MDASTLLDMVAGLSRSALWPQFACDLEDPGDMNGFHFPGNGKNWLDRLVEHVTPAAAKIRDGDLLFDELVLKQHFSVPTPRNVVTHGPINRVKRFEGPDLNDDRTFT